MVYYSSCICARLFQLHLRSLIKIIDDVFKYSFVGLFSHILQILQLQISKCFKQSLVHYFIDFFNDVVAVYFLFAKFSGLSTLFALAFHHKYKSQNHLTLTPITNFPNQHYLLYGNLYLKSIIFKLCLYYFY